MEKRILGKTGQRISVLGFGGIVIGDADASQACRLVSQAIDRGINYFDMGPGYGDCELRLGPALKGYRDSVFLACKTQQRSADGARDELHRSLKRLQTDHLDLYQFHAVSSMDHVDEIMGAGGAMGALLEAREAGLVRYLGFSTHSEAPALRMLESFPFDSILLPINRACWTQGGFGATTVDKAVEKGTGVLALKALADRPWRDDEERKWPKCWYSPVDTLPEVSAALRFTLSKPVTAAVCPGHAELLWLACDALETLGETQEETDLTPESVGEPIFQSDN